MADTGFDVVSYLMGRRSGSGGRTASNISYDNTSSGLTSTNVQDAIDEVSGKIDVVTEELNAVLPELGSITFSASWSGTDPYMQTVTVTGVTVTANSQIELLPTAAQLGSLITDGVTALTIENNAGTLTAYALGAAPSAAMTVACNVLEVA